MMKNVVNLFLTLLIIISISSCSKYLKSGMGGSTDVSLTRTSDEYTIKRLKTIELEGRSLFGIPGFGTNNQNKNKTGLVFKFNGVQIGRVPRIAPILTMIGFTMGYGAIAKTAIFDKVSTNKPLDNTLSTSLGVLVGIPFAGITNNLVWYGNATSGLTNQMYYKLVDENPDVDIFTNPKYKIEYNHGLFGQKAKITANVMGATLKIK